MTDPGRAWLPLAPELGPDAGEPKQTSGMLLHIATTASPRNRGSNWAAPPSSLAVAHLRRDQPHAGSACAPLNNLAAPNSAAKWRQCLPAALRDRSNFSQSSPIRTIRISDIWVRSAHSNAPRHPLTVAPNLGSATKNRYYKP